MSEAKDHPDAGKAPEEETAAKTDDAREQERQAELQEKLHDMGVMPRPEEMPEITPRRLTRTLVVGMGLLVFIIAGIYWWHEQGETAEKERAESPSAVTSSQVANPPAAGPVASVPGNAASQGPVPVTSPSSADDHETQDANGKQAPNPSPYWPWQPPASGPVTGLPANGASQGAMPVTPPPSAGNNENPEAGSNTAAPVPPVSPRWGPPPARGYPSPAWTPAYGWQPPPPGWTAPSPPPAPAYPGWGPYGYYPPPPRW